MNLRGNTILITGGATGIGLVMAHRFMSLGNQVAVCGRRQQVLDDACKKHPDLKAYRCDVSDQEQRQNLLAALEQDGMLPNVIVNNAAVMGFYQFAQLCDEDFDSIERDIKINLLSPIALNTLFLPALIEQARLKQRAPVIINVTSPGGVVPVSNVPVYCATKAALNSYSKSLRYQLRGQVEVIEVFPPSVDTAMMEHVDLRMVSVDKFADELLRKLEKGGDVIWIGEGIYLKWIHRISPTFAYWLVNRTAKLK